jgi:transcriptional regulator with XRE-family HTH domain
MMSSNLKLDKRRRTFIRLLGDIQHVLNQALDEEYQKRGLTRAGLARAIGRDKSFVTKKLNGTSNMTLETLADLAFALDRAVRVYLPERTEPFGTNRFELSQRQTAPQPLPPPKPVSSDKDGAPPPFAFLDNIKIPGKILGSVA